MYKLEFANSFIKDFRKISHEVQKEVMSKWLPRLQENPLIGKRFKVKNLHDFLRLAFRYKRNDYRIAYQIHNKTLLIVLLAIGSRENFYKRLNFQKGFLN